MKAEELRIGNLINTRRKYDSIVIELSKDKCKCENKELLVTIESIYDFIEPIPITEEWLVKFGFKKSSLDGCFYITRNYMRVCNNHDKIVTKRFYIFLTDGKFNLDKYREKYIDILYVHQLQNLYFALTGKELTFNM